MILQASYNEINDIIRNKSGRDVYISYKDVDTLDVTVTASVKVKLIGPFSKSIEKSFSADIHIVGISGSFLTADVDAGRLGSLVLSQAKSFILSKAPEGLVDSIDGKRMVLNLVAIPQAKAVFDNLVINNLTIAENAVYVDASLKDK